MTQRQTVTPMWVSLCGRFNVWLQTHDSPRCLCPSAAELRPLTNTLGLQLMLACVRAEGGPTHNPCSGDWAAPQKRAMQTSGKQISCKGRIMHSLYDPTWHNWRLFNSKRSSCSSDLTLKHTLDWSSSQKNIILFSTLLDIAWQQE